MVAICNCIVLRDVEQPQDHPALKECLLTLIFRSTDLDSCFWTFVFKRSFLRPSVNSKKNIYVCVLCCFSCVRLFATLWTVAQQAPLSMGFSRQQYWSGLPCPTPGYHPNPGIKPMPLRSPALAAGSLPLAPPGKPSTT